MCASVHLWSQLPSVCVWRRKTADRQKREEGKWRMLLACFHIPNCGKTGAALPRRTLTSASSFPPRSLPSSNKLSAVTSCCCTTETITHLPASVLKLSHGADTHWINTQPPVYREQISPKGNLVSITVHCWPDLSLPSRSLMSDRNNSNFLVGAPQNSQWHQWPSNVVVVPAQAFFFWLVPDQWKRDKRETWRHTDT